MPFSPTVKLSVIPASINKIIMVITKATNVIPFPSRYRIYPYLFIYRFFFHLLIHSPLHFYCLHFLQKYVDCHYYYFVNNPYQYTFYYLFAKKYLFLCFYFISMNIFCQELRIFIYSPKIITANSIVWHLGTIVITISYVLRKK